MNDRKLAQLFAAARSDVPPAPPLGFDRRVVAALPHDNAPASASLLPLLEALFPRAAMVAVGLLALCVAADFGHAMLTGQSLSDGVDQLSSQWTLNLTGDL